MKKNAIQVGLISLICLGFLIVFPQILNSAEPYQDSATSSRRWSLSLNGGYAYSESRGGMMDLTAEVQFRFSPKFWTGVSIGYLSDSDKDHMTGNFSGMSGGMMGGSMMSGFTGHSHDFRAVPLVVNLYYGLPHQLEISTELGSTYTTLVKLELVYSDDFVDRVKEIILEHAQTGHRGDGSIAVSPVEEAISIRLNSFKKEVNRDGRSYCSAGP